MRLKGCLVLLLRAEEARRRDGGAAPFWPPCVRVLGPCWV